MMRLRTLGAVIILALAAARPGAAGARPLNFDLAEAPIWAEPRQDGSVAGLGPIWARMLLERAGVEARIRAVPNDQLLDPRRGPDTDFLILLDRSSAKSGAVTILTPLMQTDVVLIARRGIPIQSEDDVGTLNGIAVVGGTGLGAVLRLDPRYTVEEVPAMENGLRMLSAGHVDAVAGIGLSIDIQAARLGLSETLGARIVLSPITISLAATPARVASEEAAALIKAAGELSAEGAFVKAGQAFIAESKAAVKR